MKLDGLHHITMITGDAQRNVNFYADVLGLRLVKKTVNFDAPEAYHLYFGDETGTPGSILTWFEFAPADEPAFDELLGALRTTEEWNYVDREVDIRLIS